MVFMARWIVLLFTLALSLAAPCLGEIFPFFHTQPPPPTPQAMARVASLVGIPANSSAAFRRCLEDGLAWTTVEVQATSDGEFVLASPTVQTTHGPWQVAEHTQQDYRELDIGSAYGSRWKSQTGLTLSETLVWARLHWNLFLRCGPVDPQRFVKYLRGANMEQQCIVTGDVDWLAKVYAVAPGKIALAAALPPGESPIDWAKAHHLTVLELPTGRATAAVVAECHHQGIRVKLAFDPATDNRSGWAQAAACGADWLETARPEEWRADQFNRGAAAKKVRISCHRGAHRYAPENTLPAFEKAIRLGVDLIEFDIRTSSDGQYFLLHDGLLDRTTDGHGPIAKTPASALRQLHANDGWGAPFAQVPLPTLDEFLAAVRGKIDLYVDAKVIPVDALAEALERHQVADRAIVYQSADYLAQLVAKNPKIRALPPLSRSDGLPAILAKLKPYAVDVDWNILSRDLIQQCHQAGVLVFSDAMDGHETLADYRQAIEWGIDVIQTDTPLQVMRAKELAYPGPDRKGN